MPKLFVALALLGMLGVSACRDSGGEGEYFRIDGKIFVFNYRVATATYLVNLVPLRPVEEGQTAVVSFEDPAGGEPLVVRQKIWPKMPKTTIESPPLRCVVKDRPYKVSIAIEGPDGDVRQTIETTMASSEDQSLLPDKPLVVGPLYTPNPELKGNPGGELPDSDMPPCPPASSSASGLILKHGRIVRLRHGVGYFLAQAIRSPAKHCSFWVASDFV